MKLSDLKPCGACRKPLMQVPQVRPFYVIRMSMAMINADRANRVLGLMHAMGGTPANINVVEAMSPDSECVMVMGDEQAELGQTLFICQDCYLGQVCLAAAQGSA